MNRNRIIMLILIAAVLGLACLKWQIPFRITKNNVKSIYCKVLSGNSENRTEVSPADKEMIISEVSKLKPSGVEGQVGTIPYVFIIELKNGTEFSFYENTKGTVSIHKSNGEFFRNIKAPKTAEFIQRFLKEHNINKTA